MKTRAATRFTLVELLVVIAVIAILFSLSLPAFKRSKDMANSISCKSNLRQIGIAFNCYANDYNGFYPRDQYASGAWIWCNGNSALAPAYIDDKLVYGGNAATGYSGRACPSVQAMYEYAINWYVGYAYPNISGPPYNHLRQTIVGMPSSTFLVTDSNGSAHYVAESMAQASARWRHGGGAFSNWLYCDGHVADMS